ncbi:hypothetical protein YQE_05698, partial [Dendroctonus ponderosae]
MFSVAHSRWNEKSPPIAIWQLCVAPPMRSLRQDAEHQTYSEEAQGTATPPTAEQRPYTTEGKSEVGIRAKVPSYRKHTEIMIH